VTNMIESEPSPIPSTRTSESTPNSAPLLRRRVPTSAAHAVNLTSPARHIVRSVLVDEAPPADWEWEDLIMGR